MCYHLSLYFCMWYSQNPSKSMVEASRFSGKVPKYLYRDKVDGLLIQMSSLHDQSQLKKIPNCHS